MKYSETYFKFPIKVYNEKSIKEAKDYEEATGNPTETDWVEGIGKIKLEDILGWFDSYPEGVPQEEVAKNGFSETIVETKELGSMICTWNRKKFERELDKHWSFINDVFIEETKKRFKETMNMKTSIPSYE